MKFISCPIRVAVLGALVCAVVPAQAPGDPRLFEAVVRLAQACRVDGNAGCETGHPDYTDRALKMRAEVRPLDLHHSDLLMDLGRVAAGEDRYRDALMVYGEALEIREPLLGTTHQKIAETYMAMAWVYQQQKDPVQARTTMQHALEIREQAGAAGTAGYADLVGESADLYRAAKDVTKARQEYARAIALYERLWRPADPRFVAALREIARENQSDGELSLAERLFRRVAEIQKEAHPSGEDRYAALKDLAEFLFRQKRPADAEPVYLDAFNIRQRFAQDDAEAAMCMRRVAECRLSRGLYRPAADAGEQSLWMDDSALATYGLLIEAHLRLRNDSRSDEYLRMLLAHAGAAGRSYVIRAAETASAIYRERGNYPRAAQKLELAIATREAANAKDVELPARMLELGRLYQAMGRLADANRVNWRAMKQGSSTADVSLVLVALPLVVMFFCGPLYWLLSRRLDRASDTPAPATTERVAVRAEGTALFSIRVLNLLLSLLTLGVYGFWGKAKVRGFLCGQSEFLGDRFAFHGTGRELLLGWLRALPALAFVFLLPQVVPVIWPGASRAAPLAGIGVFLLLWPVARVGAYRYRMNRMSWRGIRFSYRGTALRFAGASVAGGLLAVATLGVYAPFLQVRLRGLLFNRTYFGNREFQFSGRGRDLLPAWIFAMPFIVCTFGAGWAWWSALRHRYYWAHTTFAGARFRCTATGRKLLGLWIGNAAILILTIGLGMSWTTLRTLRFWTRHIELVGDPELAIIRQDARAASASGESFADFLGFDFGF